MNDVTYTGGSPRTLEKHANHEEELYDVIEGLEDDVKGKEEMIDKLKKQLEEANTSRTLLPSSETSHTLNNEITTTKPKRRNSMSDEDFIGVEDLSTAYAMIQQSHGYYVRCSWIMSVIVIVMLTFSYYHFMIDYYPCFLDEYKITS